MKNSRLPRKVKKELKKKILENIDKAWKSRNVLITSFKKNHRFSNKVATFKGISVTGYQLN